MCLIIQIIRLPSFCLDSGIGKHDEKKKGRKEKRKKEGEGKGDKEENRKKKKRVRREPSS